MATKNPGVWGIDLGQCALKAVRLEEIDGKVTATAFDYVEHPKILSQPDADPDELVRGALEKFLERNDLQGDTVAIGVPGQSGLARFVKLPPVEEKKIADIVRFEAKQQIPFPLEEVIWDFQKISAGTVSDGYALETEIGLFAMKRDMVDRALRQFQDVNVEVHVIQMTPLALVNFIAYDLLAKDPAEPKEGDEEEEGGGQKQCVVALDIGADTSNLVITDGERIIWQRPIPIGGNRFTRDLTRDLKLTFAKAEHVKRNAVKSPDLRKILLALRPGLNDFVNEVQRSLGYFTNTHRNATVRYMVGLGNAFRLPGLQKFLQEKLQLEVRKLQKTHRLAGDEVLNQPQFKENILSFTVACGLALQGLEKTRIQTNLLPQEIRTERLIRAKKPWAVATAAALLLGIAGLTFGSGRQLAAYKNDDVTAAVKRVDQAVGIVQQRITEYNELDSQIKKSKATYNRIGAGVKERFNWNLVFQYVNLCAPWPNPARPKIAIRTKDRVFAKKIYVTEDAAKAYQHWLYKLSAAQDKEGADPAKERKIDKFIKKNLVQINIEGVMSLFSEDLTPYYARIDSKLTQGKLLGEVWLPKRERDNIKQKQNLPKRGWLFEVRGYTTWQPKPEQDPTDFILRTIVENLRYPTAPGVNLPLTAEMRARVLDPSDPSKSKLGYVFLYNVEKVSNPTPGSLAMANHSYLQEALGNKSSGAAVPGGGNAPMASTPEGGGPGVSPGGGDPSVGQPQAGQKTGGEARKRWRPIGEIASAAFGGGSGASPLEGSAGPAGAAAAAPPVGPEGAATPSAADGKARADEPMRTEFIIMFVWQEPSSLEAADASNPDS